MKFFVEKSLNQNKKLYRVKGNDRTGKRAWYLVLVPKLKSVMFEKALKSGALKITDYGNVIASGYGEEPSEKIINFYKEKHSI
jgi:hypothetical protein